MSPATPFSFPVYGEAYQVRCQTCGIAAMVGHPQQWVPPLGGAFVYESYPPTVATAQYLQLAFPYMR